MAQDQYGNTWWKIFNKVVLRSPDGETVFEYARRDNSLVANKHDLQIRRSPLGGQHTSKDSRLSLGNALVQCDKYNTQFLQVTSFPEVVFNDPISRIIKILGEHGE